jgi:hypothetical protein
LKSSFEKEEARNGPQKEKDRIDERAAVRCRGMVSFGGGGGGDISSPTGIIAVVVVAVIAIAAWWFFSR